MNLQEEKSSMKIEKNLKPKASNAPSSLVNRTTLVLCMLVSTLFLVSCQPYPPYGTTYSHGYRPQVIPIYYQLPPQTQKKQMTTSARKSSSQSHHAVVAKKRMPKPQSSHMMPPPTTHGYHARLDKSRYPTMGYRPFYRVVGVDGSATYLHENVFWEWYHRAIKSGVYVKIFDPYDPNAPPAK